MFWKQEGFTSQKWTHVLNVLLSSFRQCVHVKYIKYSISSWSYYIVPTIIIHTYIYNPIEYNCSTMLNIICTTRHWFIIYSRKLTQIPVTYLKRPEPRPTVYRRSHGEHSFFELFEIQSPVLATMVPGHAPRYVQYWMNWGPIWSPKKERCFSWLREETYHMENHPKKGRNVHQYLSLLITSLGFHTATYHYLSQSYQYCFFLYIYIFIHVTLYHHITGLSICVTCYYYLRIKCWLDHFD